MDVTPKQKELSDFYITNVVTRHSPTLAKARKAAIKDKVGRFMFMTVFAILTKQFEE